jgi:hypothetical protein
MAMIFAEWIAERFQLPAVSIPDLEGLEPELAAEAVRAAWGLGSGPAPNLVHLHEAHGCLVFGLAEDCRELDAFAFWRQGRPFVPLNTIKTAEHGRFDCAHELGHLALHRHVCQTTKEHEDKAHAFAAAFLLPKQSMLAAGFRRPLLDGSAHTARGAASFSAEVFNGVRTAEAAAELTLQAVRLISPRLLPESAFVLDVVHHEVAIRDQKHALNWENVVINAT